MPYLGDMAISIFINGPIGFPPGEVPGEEGTLLSDVRRQYDAQAKDKPREEVMVFINSPGGDVDEGFAIYDYLNNLPNSITTIGEGRVFSIASVIFLAGEKRLLTENASVLIHNPMAAMFGEAGDMEKAAQYLRSTASKIAALYAQKTGQPMADIENMMDVETTLEAKDAISLGFATGTYQPQMKAVAWVSKDKIADAAAQDLHKNSPSNKSCMSTHNENEGRKNILDQIKALLNGSAKNEVPEVVDDTPQPEVTPEAQEANPLEAENKELKEKLAKIEGEKSDLEKRLGEIQETVNKQKKTLAAVNAKIAELEDMPVHIAKDTPVPIATNSKKTNVQLPQSFLDMENHFQKRINDFK